MENYKVLVSNEAESKEVCGLFSGLDLCLKDWSPSFSFPFFISNHMDGEFSNYSPCDGGLRDYKELTIPQLKDMVVLKRNDLSDKTHETANCDAKGFLTSDGIEYFWNYRLGEWNKYKTGDFLDYDMQPIEREEMKEYLELQEDGSYKLVLRGECCKADDIEVPPSGVNAYNYLYKNGINLAWTEKPTSHYGELLWQRSETKNVQGKKDNVNNPSHYSDSAIECIDAMEAMLTPDQFIGYLRGNMFKYQWRYQKKNGVEDLKKSQWYLNKLIEVEDGNS